MQNIRRALVGMMVMAGLWLGTAAKPAAAQVRMMSPPPELPASDHRYQPAVTLIRTIMAGDRAAAETFIKQAGTEAYAGGERLAKDLDAVMPSSRGTAFDLGAVRLMPEGSVIVEVTVGDAFSGFMVQFEGTDAPKIAGVRKLRLQRQ